MIKGEIGREKNGEVSGKEWKDIGMQRKFSTELVDVSGGGKINRKRGERISKELIGSYL